MAFIPNMSLSYKWCVILEIKNEGNLFEINIQRKIKIKTTAFLKTTLKQSSRDFKF